MIKVNLLPEENKQEIEDAKSNLKLLKLFYQLLIVTIATAVIIGGLYFYFQTQISSASKALLEKEKYIDKYANLEENAKISSDKLNTIKQINSETNKWSGVINEINKVVPTGVYLNGVKLDSNSKVRGQITGYALSKSVIANFQDALERSEKFEFVDIEGSQLLADPATNQERESFTISLSFTKGALR